MLQLCKCLMLLRQKQVVPEKFYLKHRICKTPTRLTVGLYAQVQVAKLVAASSDGPSYGIEYTIQRGLEEQKHLYSRVIMGSNGRLRRYGLTALYTSFTCRMQHAQSIILVDGLMNVDLSLLSTVAAKPRQHSTAYKHMLTLAGSTELKQLHTKQHTACLIHTVCSSFSLATRAACCCPLLYGMESLANV